MRILWFSNTPSLATEHLTGRVGVGGGWIESLEAKLVEKEGVELAICFPWKTDKVMSFELGKTKYYGYPIIPTGKFARWKARRTGAIEPPEELDFYREVIKDFQPDLVHIFGTERSYGMVIPELNVPSVFNVQGNLTVYQYRFWVDILESEVKKYSSLKDKIKGNTWYHKFLNYKNGGKREEKIFSYAHNIIGRTDWDRRISLALAPQATYHHCDAIMRPVFYNDGVKKWRPHDRKKFVILTTMRPSPYKGIGTIMDTMAILKRVLPVEVEWRIAGAGKNDKTVEILRKARNLSPEKLNVNLMGLKTPEELVEELEYADVYVHPTNIENESNAVIEAHLVGTPVVATHAGGVTTTVQDKVEGLLVQDKDPWALAGALIEMYQNPDKALEYSEAAFKKTIVRNDPDKLVEDLRVIYHRMMENWKVGEASPVS
ncbi:MAG: glycosyltransferase [Bacteroidia bacterium]|nr:glycosyltransferase [Bacteroidia bacterium]